MKVIISAFAKDRAFRDNFKDHLHLKNCLFNYSPFVLEAIGGYVYEGDTEATEEISCIVDLEPSIAVNIAKMFNQEAIIAFEMSTGSAVLIKVNKGSEPNEVFKMVKAESLEGLKGYTIIENTIFTLESQST
jgi:hypothetical protein